MKKFLLFLFSLSVGTGLFVWIIKSVGVGEILIIFKAFSLKFGLFILLLTFLTILIRSWRWYSIVRKYGCKVPFLKIVEYYFSGNTISFFAPMVVFGGEIFRCYDLQEK